MSETTADVTNIDDTITGETKPTPKRRAPRKAPATPKSTATQSVLAEVEVERSKQDERWGQQNHDLTPSPESASYYARRANAWKTTNDAREVRKTLTWDGILMEEVNEAFAEQDSAKVRAELIQVAAVAVAAIESIDRRNA